jgi:hypothetical protein
MDIDTQKKMDLVRQMALKHNATDKALSSKHARSKPPQSRISKSIIEGSKKDESLKDRSESSIAFEGGGEEMMEEGDDMSAVMIEEDPRQADEKFTVNDETKNNLLKQ